MKITMLVPTRNRPAELNIAVSALQNAIVPGIEIVVSDNSDDEFAKLNENLLRANSGSKIRYIRPRESLTMAAHWGWAIDQVDGDYVGIVTDRFRMAPDALRILDASVRRWAPDCISYAFDTVEGSHGRYRLIRRPYEHRALLWQPTEIGRMPTSREPATYLLVPRAMLGLFRRSMIQEMKAEFGSVCGTIAPDYAFALRAMLVGKTFVYLDRPLATQFAVTKSNGDGVKRGDGRESAREFLERVGDNLPHELRDVADFARSAIVAEYLKLKTEVDLPDIDWHEFVLCLQGELQHSAQSTALRDRFIRVEAFSLARNIQSSAQHVVPGFVKNRVTRFLEGVQELAHPLNLVSQIKVSARPSRTLVTRGFRSYPEAFAAIDASPRPPVKSSGAGVGAWFTVSGRESIPCIP